jgi:NAD(P)-dependent dehydrogenase (short-subunit alcohol dehydrogenase family)
MSVLQNKSVLITGANRGIGAALVEEALEQGAYRVYAACRQPLNHPDDRVVSVVLDITDAEQVAALTSTVEALDILVNNAGIALYDDLSDPEAIAAQFDVNVFGPLAVTTALVPQLSKAQGYVVNNLSLNALAPMPIIAGYSMSKAAAFSMTQSLRTLLAPRHIAVRAVLTGPVDTDMSRGVDIPKASPGSVAAAIYDALEQDGADEIFPDAMSQQFADGWRNSGAKALEREYAAAATAMEEGHVRCLTKPIRVSCRPQNDPQS